MTPPCTPEQASRLAAAALADTLAVVGQTPARGRVLALRGRPGPWVPAGFEVVPQVQGSLNVRIAAALASVDGPVLLVGMDTPQLTTDLLTCDFSRADAYLGAAEDGGFWALGLADPDPAPVFGVPMSVSHTGAVLRQRLLASGLRVADLPPLRDVDTWDDAVAVAAQAPHTRFAHTMAGLNA
nr:DUF2064 domain-containing protein [Actinopolymorpha cephalotaxi]